MFPGLGVQHTGIVGDAVINHCFPRELSNLAKPGVLFKPETCFPTVAQCIQPQSYQIVPKGAAQYWEQVKKGRGS